ncbi:MAG: hypothetical protein WA705_02935 [Candidatus Ozemobacteraceae bacterium]
MTLKDLTLMGLLGACGGLGVLSTSVFFAFIPFPGAGAILFMPLSAACLTEKTDFKGIPSLNHADILELVRKIGGQANTVMDGNGFWLQWFPGKVLAE